MPIYLVRHGETIWNREKRKQGSGDAPLTKRGIESVLACAARLKSLLPEPGALKFRCSPLRRAQQSAVLIADTLALDPARIQTDPMLRELDFGAWEGLTEPEIEERFPGQNARFAADRWGFAPPLGESFAACVQRARAWLSAQGPNANVLAVTHGYMSRALRGAYRKLPDAEFLRLPIVHGALYELRNGEVIEHAE